MVKRIAIGFVLPLIGAILMTSCSKDKESIERTSTVAMLSFGIKDIRTVHYTQDEEGKITPYTTITNGSLVKFTINQTNNSIYNADSIAYGTNLSRVAVNVKADGNVCYLKANGEAGAVEDSIDFTTPVTFRVISNDEKFYRDYKVSINAHQVNPKETVWKKVEGANLPCLNEQRAFVKGNSLYVIGYDADGVYYTASAALTDVSAWATTPCSGIEGAGLSALLIDDTFYLKTDAKLYRSDDAIAWTAVDDEDEIFTLPTDMHHVVAWLQLPLTTNPDITRTIFVTTPETPGTYAQVWTQLSTEEKPIEIGSNGNNIYGCPNLEGLVVIQYAGKMYAFGGKSVGDLKEPLAPFSACYESRDHGVTWKVNEEAFSLPKDFGKAQYATETFSAATDGEYVWVMWGNGDVWRGRWNGVK